MDKEKFDKLIELNQKISVLRHILDKITARNTDLYYVNYDLMKTSDGKVFDNGVYPSCKRDNLEEVDILCEIMINHREGIKKDVVERIGDVLYEMERVIKE